MMAKEPQAFNIIGMFIATFLLILLPLPPSVIPLLKILTTVADRFRS
jgi:hypothetical protein